MVSQHNTSTVTLTTDIPSTRVSSTIMTENCAIENNSNNSHHKNAMTKTEHEVISIKNRVPIKSIRIERDYSLGDGITRFYTNYPEDLQGLITPEQFKHTIEEVNRMMDYADRLSWKVILENIMETLTIYLWPVLFSTHYQRAIDRLHAFIDSENQNVYHPHNLSISDPVKSAFLFIEINFYE
ncbi:hypothetical protein RMCBS344292_12565 [Rhizopus microsporus]|nr:hypothetical protein RMCBS344292_12565 [Rhizopus microsporus]